MAKSDSNCEPLRRLGAQLRTVRRAAGLTQAQVCLALGMKGISSRSYLHRLEKGDLNNVALMTIMRYLQACKAVRGAVDKDPTPDVQMAFDRIEQAGLARLVPAAVRKTREVVFARLMEMAVR